MKIYKDYMDSVTAPEDLIERTRQKMQTEASAAGASEPPPSAHGSASPPRKFPKLLPAAAAAAAAVLLIVTVLLPKAQPAAEVCWQVAEVSTGKELPQAETADASGSGQSAAEAAALLPSGEFSEYFPGFEMVKEEHSESSSVYYLRKGNASVRYLLSSDKADIPEVLWKLEPQRFGTTEARFAVSPDGNYHYAVWESDGILHYVTAGSISDADLSAFLQISGFL